MSKRPLSLAGIILSVFLLPWWLTLLAALMAVFTFKRFFEILAPALLFDALYFPLNGNRFVWPALSLSLVLILISYLARQYLRHGLSS